MVGRWAGLVLVACVAGAGPRASRVDIAAAHGRGEARDVAALCEAALATGGDDGGRPSLHHYLGWARHVLGDVAGATAAFLAAVSADPGDARAWLHLGDCLLVGREPRAAVAAFGRARDAARGDAATARDALAKLVKAKTWVADWEGLDQAASAVAAAAARNVDAASVEGLAVPHVASRLPLATARDLSRRQAHAIPPSGLASTAAPGPPKRRPLRVGFVAADLGAHPVTTTLRGALLALDELPTVEVRLFALGPADSWWRQNLTQSLQGRVHDLSNTSPADAAKLFLESRLHVLVDLAGHTLGSGLPLLGAPALKHVLRLSFCGWPATTGAPFVRHVVCPRGTSYGAFEMHRAPRGAARGLLGTAR